MLTNIVVDCSPLTNTLRIGRLDKRGDTLAEWEEREDEIINAVRDHLVRKAEEQSQSTFGYVWNRKDGKTVILRIEIKEGQEEKHDN